MEIGVYCGSFDPIHTGHALLANYIAQFTDIDEVWLMVSPRNPIKSQGYVASDAERLEMVELVASSCRNVVASDFEFSLPLPSYTYVTLCNLRERFPGHNFRLIIGSDNWEIFHRWRNADEIRKEFGLMVYPRPGHPVSGDLPGNVELLADAPVTDVSSTFIRRAISEGKDMNFFLPEKVSDYISLHRLYC